MQELCTNVVLPDAPWVSQPTAESFTVCKIGQRKYSTDGETIPVVTTSLMVRFNCSWVVVVHGKQVAIKHRRRNMYLLWRHGKEKCDLVHQQKNQL